MRILTVSVWLRYLELLGERFTFPKNGYQGDYIKDIAASLKEQQGEAFFHSADSVFQGVPPDEPEGGNKETHIDALIVKAKSLLSEEQYNILFQAGLTTILKTIEDDMAAFGVTVSEWFSELDMTKSGAVKHAFDVLVSQDSAYEEEGALWLRSTRYGDEKDRVLRRTNGDPTYVASDIAYHLNKFERGFDRVIDIFGADHHGYVPRIKGGVQAMGIDVNKLEVLLVQFATLFRGKEKVQMSTRSGEFVTLRELCDEVGSDATRYFYVARKIEQHLEFDLELAKSRSNENPVYYIQYAHARIGSVFRQCKEKGITWDGLSGHEALNLLTETQEKTLLSQLSQYKDVLQLSAVNYEPHTFAHYLRELATAFHSYYNAHQFLVEDETLRNARLCLIMATKICLSNGLKLLGVSAPEEM